MKKITVVFLFALCPLIPVSARFAYGLILAVAMCWYLVAGIIVRELVKRLDIGATGPTVELVSLALSATAFYLALSAYSPVNSVSLGLYILITAFSYLILLGIDTFTPDNAVTVPLLQVVPVLLFFSALREILGFGTISLPVPDGLRLIEILPGFSGYGLGFWGTTGGALILLSFLAWTIKYLHRRIGTFRRNF